MNIITHLLLSVFIVISPMMLYQIFWIDRIRNMDKRRNRLLIAAFCTVTAWLSSSYPILMESGVRLDLSLIPIAVCFFAAGARLTIAAAALTMLHRLWLSGEGFAPELLITILAMLLFAWLKRKKETPIRELHPGLTAMLGLSISLTASIVWTAYHAVTGLPFHGSSLFMLLAYVLVETGTAVLAALAIRRIAQAFNMRGEALHHEKLNMLSELAVSFANEIRNPVTVSRGFVQLMKQNDLPEDKRSIYNQLVLEELGRAQSMIDDYLSFSRPQIDALQLVDAKQLVVKALRSLEEFAGLRNVKFEIELQDRMMISANREKFTQSIINLCKNGIESMPGGGTLRIVGAQQSQTVSIHIIDQGVGMSANEVNRLGTPYCFTRGKGTGLGMMVAYKAIQHIHGRIDVTTEPGRGTCFTIVLPALQPSSYH